MVRSKRTAVQRRLDQLEIPKLQIMRYMGNKRSLVRGIVPEIAKLAQPGDIVLDLFSGTCAVGYGLKRHFVVYANDLQAYAEKIAEALLKWKPPIKPNSKLLRRIEELYNQNMRELKKSLAEPLDKEEAYFTNGIDTFNWGSYKRFSEEYPFYGGSSGDGYSKHMLALFSDDNIRSYHSAPDDSPYLLFSTYFANGYFGVKQAAQIDSLRYAIDNVPDGKYQRSFLLTCLISSASKAVSSTGHFAQFRNITTPEVCGEVVSERRKDLLTIFKEKFAHFAGEVVDSPEYRDRNRVFREDYGTLFQAQDDLLRSVEVIYADPPYTPAQYSRFYHILETLVKYDYPASEFVGRYRSDRTRSDFCRYSGFRREFEGLACIASQFSPNLVISYSSNGLFEDISELMEIVSGYYSHVSKVVFAYHHSRQGRPSKLEVDEYLVIGSQEKD